MGCTQWLPAWITLSSYFGSKSSVNRVVFVLLLLVTWPSNPGVAQEIIQYSRQLHRDLLLSYNRYLRPVADEHEVVSVTLGLVFLQVIDLDEINQIMTASVSVRQNWTDPNLSWDPSRYGNVSRIYLPAVAVWLPDLVLYNNADGGYELPLATKPCIYWNGSVVWSVPMILKSSCDIDVRFFPFDDQTCEMQFGSWTYNVGEVTLSHYNSSQALKNDSSFIPHGMDITNLYRSFEFDVLGVPAHYSLVHYSGESALYPSWSFAISLRRKSSFYVVNLIIPIIAHAMLTAFVFYLPSDSREKMCLAISLLFSLCVFFLLFAELFPPTSIVLPLLGKYLVFTLVLISLSIVVTGVTLNVHYRTTETHVMPTWIRKIFLYSLPRLLRMQRPKIENSHDVELKHIRLHICTCLGCSHTPLWKGRFANKTIRAHPKRPSHSVDQTDLTSAASTEVRNLIDSAIFIADHLKQEDESKRIKEDWKYIAMVIDRLFLVLYLTVITVSNVVMCLSVPRFYQSS